MREISFEEMQLVGGGGTNNIDDGTSPFDVVSPFADCSWQGFIQHTAAGALTGVAYSLITGGSGVAIGALAGGITAGIFYGGTCWRPK